MTGDFHAGDFHVMPRMCSGALQLWAQCPQVLRSVDAKPADKGPMLLGVLWIFSVGGHQEQTWQTGLEGGVHLLPPPPLLLLLFPGLEEEEQMRNCGGEEQRGRTRPSETVQEMNK